MLQYKNSFDLANKKGRRCMCYFREIKQIRSNNELQTVITRTIMCQTEIFNYEGIVTIIKAEFRRLGVQEYVINSFRVNNMISETLEQLISSGDIYSFNNRYVPMKQELKLRKTIYAFA